MSCNNNNNMFCSGVSLCVSGWCVNVSSVGGYSVAILFSTFSLFYLYTHTDTSTARRSLPSLFPLLTLHGPCVDDIIVVFSSHRLFIVRWKNIFCFVSFARHGICVHFLRYTLTIWSSSLFPVFAVRAVLLDGANVMDGRRRRRQWHNDQSTMLTDLKQTFARTYTGRWERERVRERRRHTYLYRLYMSRKTFVLCVFWVDTIVRVTIHKMALFRYFFGLYFMLFTFSFASLILAFIRHVVRDSLSPSRPRARSLSLSKAHIRMVRGTSVWLCGCDILAVLICFCLSLTLSLQLFFWFEFLCQIVPMASIHHKHYTRNSNMAIVVIPHFLDFTFCICPLSTFRYLPKYSNFFSRLLSASSFSIWRLC